jgi:xylobiose transport system permease protein
MARRSTTRPNWLAGAFSIVWLVIIAVPILSMLVWGMTTERAFRDAGPLALPEVWTFDNFANVIDRGFLTFYWNTAIITVGSIVLALALALPAAYTIVRSKNWLASLSFRMFLLGLAIPAQAVIVPLYLMVTQMGLYDTLIAVILPTVAFALPLVILILSLPFLRYVLTFIGVTEFFAMGIFGLEL